MNQYNIQLVTVLGFLFSVNALNSTASMPFDESPINYSTSEVTDPISKLQKAIDDEKVKLEFSESNGYLKSVLKALNVSETSQTLVFTKTSFQRERIGPDKPRAVYFSDDMYIGWVQGGKVLEISAVDPKQGAMFYSLRQREKSKPRFIRHTSECLQCHGSSMTRSIPGHIVRSVFSDQAGFPVLRLGSHLVDHDTAFQKRWGGWYVSGTHGKQRHLGNTFIKSEDAEDTDDLDLDSGANVTDLNKYFDTTPYLTPHSDIVALMVLEHQTRAHNLITEASYATRRAVQEQGILNELSGDPKDKPLPFVERRLSHTGERLLKYLLFTEQAKIEPIKGTSGYAQYFSNRGPKDSKGRSLFQLNLQSKLFKYPCSYLIYSDAFNQLPERMKDYLYNRLHDIFTGKDQSPDYKSLTDQDRKAVLEILLETKPDFAAHFKKRS